MCNGTENKLDILDWSDWKRVLCVVAHPDDTEYGLSAAVNMWTRAGIEVGYLLLTAGEAGMKRDPAEAGPLRQGEQRAACDAVGVEHLTILGHADGHLMPNLDLRRDIAREIRGYRPDVVIAQNFDVEAPWGLNQADHRAVGLATIDAVRATIVISVPMANCPMSMTSIRQPKKDSISTKYSPLRLRITLQLARMQPLTLRVGSSRRAMGARM